MLPRKGAKEAGSGELERGLQWEWGGWSPITLLTWAGCQLLPGTAGHADLYVSRGLFFSST